MFGNRFFGKRYYGDRYWGEGGAFSVVVNEAFSTYKVSGREPYQPLTRPAQKTPTRDDYIVPRRDRG